MRPDKAIPDYFKARLTSSRDWHSILHMGSLIPNLPGLTAHGIACRFLIRRQKDPAEIVQFITSGIEIGQQVVVMAGPTVLKDLGRDLTENGIRAEALLRNGRLVFLTAPNCVSQLTKPGDLLQRGPLHRNGSVLRWVTDWSWAYTNGMDPGTILDYQRRIHEFIRSVTTFSLCTVHLAKPARSEMLAMLADHRRAFRSVPTAPSLNPLGNGSKPAPSFFRPALNGKRSYPPPHR